MHWPFDEVADAIGRVLERAEAALRLEQAVYGLDSMDERRLQGLIAEGLRADGFCEVAREVHYPSQAGRKWSSREQCDLVLTPPGHPLLVAERADLFTPAHACPPAEALWLEMKVAYQFREGGVRHGGYGEQWRRGTVADLRKMEADALIRTAGLLLLVFTADFEVVGRDLELFEDVLAREEVLAGFRQVRSVPIIERNGHTLATAALWPTIQRPQP